MVNLKFLLTCCCKDIQSFQSEDQNVIQVPKPHQHHQSTLVHDISGFTIAQIQNNQLPNFPKLTLTIIQSETFGKSHQFYITPKGLQNSQQPSSQTGRILIGSDQRINDIVLKDFKGVGKKHCMIQFDRVSSKFCLKDLGEGSGSFIKISSPVKLEQGNIVCIGENLISVSFHQRGSICLKFLEGSQIGKEEVFEKEQEVITFGRMADCNIQLEDNSLSRYHCRFLCEEGVGWKVSDGDGIRESTNGTWMFSQDFVELRQDSVFKVGYSLFHVSLDEG